MKKLNFLLVTTLCFTTFYAQPPTGTPSGTYPASVPNTSKSWHRGGNLPVGSGSVDNIFGTFFPSPIYTFTNSVGRMKLNGNTTNSIDGYNTPKDGFLWLGHSQGFANSWYTGTGPFSLLHLNGRDQTFIQTFGHRNWMKTGITFTDNEDLSYMGIRQVGTGFDVTETVVSWSDNSTSSDGPDDFALRFTGSGAGNTDNNYANLRDIGDNDGLHVGRFCSNGLIGFGNTFGAENISPSGYVRPQSLLHMSYDHRTGTSNEPYGFLQITYRDQANSNFPGTGETADDGLRFGIDNDQFRSTKQALYGFLRWQEQSAFVIQSDWDTGAGGVEDGERMRISSVGAPQVSNGSYYPQDNVTRVSINYEGPEEIDKPKALLHLGHNSSSDLIIPGTGNEWDNFMDYGTLVNNGKDTRAIFMGITPPSPFSDPKQNVIGFGGTETEGDLVFIEANDKEVARFDKENNNMGIGDFSPTGLIENSTCTGPPSERIDVEGNARLREVPTEASEYIMLGKKQCDDNPDDIAFRKLAFPNDPNLYLDGTGNWTTAGDGLNCWDLNGDGIQDANEDINSDQLWNHLDCQGPQGIPGTNGVVGSNGLNMLTINSPLTPGNGGCINGGVFLQFGLDANNNGVLDAGEINPALNQTICNGLNGAPGPMGPQGPAGSVNGAHNGASMSTLLTDHVAFGQNVGQLGNPGRLLNDREVPMNGKTINFSGQGTLHISQGYNNLNTNSILDINAELSTKNIGLNYVGKTTNSLINQKGLYASMNLNTNFNANTAVLEIDNTVKLQDANGWLMKLNGFYGENFVPANPNLATFGVLGNGRVGINANNSEYEGANFTVKHQTGSVPKFSNFQNNIENFGPAYRSMLVINDYTNLNRGDGSRIAAEFHVDTESGMNVYGTRSIVRNVGITHQTTSYASYNKAIGSNSSYSVGSIGLSENATFKNFGVIGDARGIGSSSPFTINAYTLNGNYGLFGYADGTNNNYGVYAKTTNNGSDNWAGYFEGKVHVVGAITATGTITSSDQMFKTNVSNISNALEKISALQPHTYNYDTINFADFNFESDLQMGLIAQEVEQVLPTIVSSHKRPAEYDSLG
jgi:hypothetical protein